LSGNIAAVGRLRRLLIWLWRPATFKNEQWSKGAYHCPKCGQELPARRPGSRAMIGAGGMGPLWLPPTPEELIAKCPFDGHPPYNHLAKSKLASGELPLTRQEPPGPLS
jgi:hypothetical protein